MEKQMRENQMKQSANVKVNSKIPNDKDDFDEYIQKSFNIGNSVMKKSKINKKKKKKKKRNKKEKQVKEE